LTNLQAPHRTRPPDAQTPTTSSKSNPVSRPFLAGMPVRCLLLISRFSFSGIGRMRTATLPNAESGRRSTIVRYISGRLVRNKPHNIPLTGGNSGRRSLRFGGGSDRAERVRCVRVADPIQPMLSVSEATSAGVRLIAAAATLSSRCDTDPVPGIGRIEGDRASSQASTICRGEAP
jgi:hypothetical protein